MERDEGRAAGGRGHGPGGGRPRLVLALLLLVLGAFKLVYSVETQALLPWRDGGYYTNVAQNVRDGNGLATNISLYHKAYSTFPHRTSIYPLWPLLHGHLARWLPIVKVGVWLPTLFYFLALLLAFLWAQEVFPRPLVEGLPWLRAGHLLVLMLGLHQPFFQFTSLPYTEGLSYTLLFAGLWRTWPGWSRPGLGRGLELGGWLGLLLLARGQFLLVAMAAFGALVVALALAEHRAGRLAMLMGATGVFGAVAFGHWLFLSSFVADAGWAALIRFDLNRESDILSPIPVLVPVDGITAYLADRASGFLVAFSPRGMYSYARSFHVFQYALVVAAPLLVLEGVRWFGPTRRRRAWDWVRSPASTAWIFLVLLAVGGFLSIHSLHKAYSNEWNFSLRQALTCVFVFFLALVYLLRSRRFGLVAFGLCLTLTSGALGLLRLTGTIQMTKAEQIGRRPWKPGLTAWLLDRRDEHGQLTVAITYGWPQRLALSTPGVNYHWVYWNTTREDLVVMFEDLGVRYLVLLRGGRPRPGFLRPGPDFWALFERVEQDVDGFRIFRLRDPAPGG